MPVPSTLGYFSSTAGFTFSKTYRKLNCIATKRSLKTFFFSDRVICNFYQITQKEFKELRDIAIAKLLPITSNLTDMKTFLSTYIYKNGKEEKN